ncbi:polymorphic toxin type 28 domain-containing protein [Nocardia sienata]|uniref:polymorphic toxin type 28 domain-containing protein n=1 Tax=Nocardia sienata TaxID=248552 RepID=UPI0007A50057|nr:polymorphic toxin type 28 domain-containing protein [Nocardia sienata]
MARTHQPVSIRTEASSISTSIIGQYRTNTEETRRQISSETTTFLVESGIIIAAAVAVSWLTVGGSLAAGAGGVVVLASDTALAISRIYRASRLWALLGLATAAAAVVAFDKVPDLTQVTTSLAAIIAARAYLDTEADGPVGTSTSDRPTKTDKIKEHLTDRDLDAARRELNGEVVARKPDGTPWDHVREVRDAQNGLVKRIDQIKRQLGDSRTNPADRAELERELSEASRLLDYSEEFVPRG